MSVEINPKYLSYNKDEVQAILDAVQKVEATLKANSTYPIQSKAVKTALDALKSELLGGASASYNTLKKLQDAIAAEATARANADTALVGGASSAYNTLKKLQDALATETSARQTADTALVGGASSGYNTMKKLEDKIKAEETARQQAVSAEATARQQAVTAETNRATAAEAGLRQSISTMSKNDYIVGPLPETGQKNKVYRVPQYADSSDSDSSDSSSSEEPEVIGFIDYMWQNGQFIPINNSEEGVDETPTAGSENLISSGGVHKAIQVFASVGEKVGEVD